MARAALTPGRTSHAYRPPDVFDERTHAVARWAVPAVVGLLYGYWAAANQRHGGPITGGNLLFGWVTAIVFWLLMVGVLHAGPHLRREPHAALWGVFAGVALGFLYAQTGDAVGAAIGIGVACGIGVGSALYYWFATHEDTEGHRI